MRAWLFIGLTGCVPILDISTIKDSTVFSDKRDCSEWAAPENQWDVSNDVPCDVSETGFNRGQVVPDMRLTDQNGDTLSLWQFYGDLIVLDFSTMWCAPCAALAEGVDETAELFEADGFTYITVLSQDHASNIPDLEDLNKWATDHNIKVAPIISDDRGFTDQVIPPGGAFPLVMLVERDMTVLVEAIQPAEDSAVRAAVRSAL